MIFPDAIPHAQGLWAPASGTDPVAMENWDETFTAPTTVALSTGARSSFQAIELAQMVQRWTNVVESCNVKVLDAEAVLQDAKADKNAAEAKLQELRKQQEAEDKKKQASKRKSTGPANAKKVPRVFATDFDVELPPGVSEGPCISEGDEP